MDKESIVRKGEMRRGVSLSVLIVAVAVTAAIVSGAFLLLRRSPAPVPAQSAPVVTPGASQAAPTIPKPSAALAATPEGSPVAAPVSAPAAPAPAPAPESLSVEELVKLKSPSVVLLQVFNQYGQMTATGSGFVAGPDGTVITNYHMIRGAYSEKAKFPGGSTADVLGVLGYSSTADLAAIRLNAAPARPLELGDSDGVEVGDRVVAIGSPLGLQNTVSDGIVSALRGGRIQTSAPISHGSSGGPFFNQQGQVIGVVASLMPNGENLNFVVPINLAKPFLEEGTLTPLADLTAQNTVVQPLMNSTVTIAARQNYELPPIVIDDNRMSDAELGGKFQSSGGVGGNIRVYVQNEQTNGILYDSGRVMSGQFDLRLQSGIYRLVISNNESLVFPRAVTAFFGLRFVK
ncbi:MAG: trypsin-like peptidase domain-containing protein [Terracidiphilus sp.]|jgi:S1-C subfamily serine protease